LHGKGQCLHPRLPQKRVQFKEERFKRQAIAGGREEGREEGRVGCADGPDEPGEIVGGEVDVGEAEVPKEGEGVLLQGFSKGEDGETPQVAMRQIQGVEGGSKAFFKSGHDGMQPSLAPFLLLVLLLLLLFLLVFVVVVAAAAAAAVLCGAVGQAQTKHTQRHPWGGRGGEEGGKEGGRGSTAPGFGEGLELVGEKGGVGEVEFF